MRKWRTRHKRGKTVICETRVSCQLKIKFEFWQVNSGLTLPFSFAAGKRPSITWLVWPGNPNSPFDIQARISALFDYLWHRFQVLSISRLWSSAVEGPFCLTLDFFGRFSGRLERDLSFHLQSGSKAAACHRCSLHLNTVWRITIPQTGRQNASIVLFKRSVCKLPSKHPTHSAFLKYCQS